MEPAHKDTFAELDGEAPELVPPGEYDLRFLYHETKQIFGRPKIFLWFSIITFGDHFEKRVPRYYGATRLKGKKGKNGGFKVGHKSDFLREFMTLFPVKANRLDRLPMSLYGKVIIVGKIRTVERAYNQRPIPRDAQYSVVDQLLSVKDAAIPSPAPPPSPPPT